MSTLAERLEKIKKGFLSQVPEEVAAKMARATEALRTSGIMEGLPRPPSPLPPFELTDTEGNLVRSSELLARGPLVVTFYRGVW
mgnify:FL=1